MPPGEVQCKPDTRRFTGRVHVAVTGAVTEFGAPGYFAFAPGFTGSVTVAGGIFR